MALKVKARGGQFTRFHLSSLSRTRAANVSVTHWNKSPSPAFALPLHGAMHLSPVYELDFLAAACFISEESMFLHNSGVMQRIPVYTPPLAQRSNFCPRERERFSFFLVGAQRWMNCSAWDAVDNAEMLIDFWVGNAEGLWTFCDDGIICRLRFRCSNL